VTDLSNQSIVFEVEGFAKNTLVVTQLKGQEGISELWAFDLKLVSRDKSLDLEKILYSPVRLGLKQGLIVGGEKAVRTRWFAGVLTDFHEQEQGQGWVTYSAHMVPKLWLTTQFHRSRIWLDKDLKGLVSSVLTGDPALSDGEDFKIELKSESDGTDEAAKYPQREFVSQYEESDFAFLSRWLEREGVFYFFDNEGEKEEVVFSDSTAAYRDSRETLPYRPSSKSASLSASLSAAAAAAAAGASASASASASAAASASIAAGAAAAAAGAAASAAAGSTLYEEDVVGSFAATANRLPKQVVLKDYNWRTPDVQLSVPREVKSDGVGARIQYNDHFKTEEQGKEFATVRVEELACRAATFQAVTNCKALRPGKTFKLQEHFRSDFNTTYLVTQVFHSAEQTVDLDGGRVAGGSYSNSLSLIPADVLFRPQRLTPWPSIHGVVHAKIDSPDTDGDFAEIDDYGRYLVWFPYDHSVDKNNKGKREGGHASRYVRMLQPYAGRDSGMHFPLLKGTDVMVAHLDGDPDRPVIVGAVPNPDTMSPVTAANNKSNKIVTTSGNTILFDDNPHCSGIKTFDATRSEIEDNRFPAGAGAGGGGGSSSPSGGSGGVQPRRKARVPRKRLKPKAPEQGSGSESEAKLPPMGQRALPRSWKRAESEADDPGAGAGALLPEPDVPEEKSAWDEFVAGSAFEAAGSSSQVEFSDGTKIDGFGFKIAGNDLTESNLKKAVNQLLRKHLSHGSSPAGAASMGELMAGMGNEMVDMIATPFGLGSPDSGAVDDYISDLETGGKQSYSIGQEKFSVFIGDNTKVFIGNAKYTFDDVGNSVSFGTGGYSYSRTDGDSFSESYQYGKDESVSIFFGSKDSFSMSMAKTHSSSMELDASESESIKIGASNSVSLFLGGESSFKFEASLKNSVSLWIGASSDIDIYAALKFKLELGAVAAIQIEIVPDDLIMKLPVSTEITVKDLKVKLDETNVKLNNTSTNMMKTNIALSETKSNLAKTQTDLAETKSQLTQTTQKLSETQTKLSETVTALSESQTKLSDEQKVLSWNVKGLALNTTGGVTMLT